MAVAVSSLYIRILVTASAVLALDQLTKQLALNSLEDGPIDLIAGVLTLRLTYNSGGAFGLGRGAPLLFLVATVGVSILILVWARKLTDIRWAIPFGLVLGGGLGNLADRVLRDLGGGVVDFIDLHVWPVFNVADSAIVVGVGLIALLSVRADRAQVEPERT